MKPRSLFRAVLLVALVLAPAHAFASASADGRGQGAFDGPASPRAAHDRAVGNARAARARQPAPKARPNNSDLIAAGADALPCGVRPGPRSLRRLAEHCETAERESGQIYLFAHFSRSYMVEV